MNERELRLLNKIADSLSAIQREIHAIYEQTNTKSDKEQPPTPIDIRSEIQLPPPIGEYYASEQRDRPESTWRDRIRLGLEIAAVIAAILAGVFTYRTLHQVQRQADAAEGQIDAIREQNRPWLKIEDITFRAPDDPKVPILSFSMLPTAPKPMNGISLEMEFHIKNIGKGVANNVYVNPKILFDSEHSPSNLIGDGEIKVCEGSQEQEPPIGPPFYRSAVFPDAEFPSNYAAIQPFDTDKISHLKDRTGDFLMMTVVGCVGYQYPRKYRTIAVFHVIGPKDQFIEVDKTLHFGEIHLQRQASYDYAQ